jgi:hypothetical protein
MVHDEYTKNIHKGSFMSASCNALVAIVALAGMSAAIAQAPPAAAPAAASPASVKELGKDRYQIGTIVVDRKAGQFTVPGRILHIDDAPLEYIAVGRAGYKGYESLLELDAIGTEFNLACILLGLDNAAVRRPDFQFDRRPPEGPPVLLGLRWQADGKSVEVPMRDALTFLQRPAAEGTPAAGPPPDDWVYTGSFNTSEDGRYAADVVGTIVGFVHDPASIIEHRAGLGIGAYGSVQGNGQLLPPIGSPVELIVTVPRAAK